MPYSAQSTAKTQAFYRTVRRIVSSVLPLVRQFQDCEMGSETI